MPKFRLVVEYTKLKTYEIEACDADNAMEVASVSYLCEGLSREYVNVAECEELKYETN